MKINLRTVFVIIFGIPLLNSSLKAGDTLFSDSSSIQPFVLMEDDPVAVILDSLSRSLFYDFEKLNTDTKQLNLYGFAADSIPVYNDSIYSIRLKNLDRLTPFELTYNDKVKAFIRLYAVKKKELTGRLLGKSYTYFPMFEEVLDKHNLPLEFKYLAVVESALIPTIRSRAGATGLWQFMYRTGKLYGLDVNSYIDERRDPYKSTEAACKYFKNLYKIYGNWELVMAAYNCGPGNVNKAIRRSGGKRNYWDIYPYLPRETRGYVPAFIAVNYIMKHYAEHNIYPVTPMVLYNEFDTLHIKEEVHFSQISEAMDINMDLLSYLNPSYKLGIIPKTKDRQVLVLPVDQIGVFLKNEEAIYEYNLNNEELATKKSTKAVEETSITHVVRNGEYLGKIANKYGVSIRRIQQWNGLSSTNIRPGQRLVIHTNKPVNSSTAKVTSTPKNVKEGDYTYYTVQSGDTLWDIAKAQGVSVDELKRLNHDLNANRLKPGDKIILKKEG